MKVSINFRRRTPTDKWIDIVVLAVAVGTGVVVAVKDSVAEAVPLWVLAGAYALFTAWHIRRSKVPDVSDMQTLDKTVEEWQSRGYEGDLLKKKGVEPLPTPGDEFDTGLDRWETEDVEPLKALWQNQEHRKQYPGCRYCRYLDKRAAAEGWERE